MKTPLHHSIRVGPNGDSGAAVNLILFGSHTYLVFRPAARLRNFLVDPSGAPSKPAASTARRCGDSSYPLALSITVTMLPFNPHSRGRHSIMRISRFIRGTGVKSLSAMLVILWLLIAFGPALAHGFAGKRFFPTTFAVEDPFVSDEFSILGSHIRAPGEDVESPVRATEIAAEYSKRITSWFGLSVGEEYRIFNPIGEGTQTGFGNLELAARYQFLTSAAHEAIMSLGLTAEVGGTGDDDVEAEPFSVISPTFLFGKGFGDLPQSLKYLKPAAVTGAFALNIPTESEAVTEKPNPETGEIETEATRNPNVLSWGLTFQYNLNYLQSFIQDIALSAPFDRMIPVVEVNMETCLDRGCGSETSGTINPGLIWFGNTVQLGVAAQIPVNDRTGNTVLDSSDQADYGNVTPFKIEVIWASC